MLIGGLAAVAAAWSVALVLYDVTSRRLPDLLTLPAGAAACVACAVWPAGLWGAVWPALYLVVGRGIGGGDIKLAVPLGVAVAVAAGPVWVLRAMGAASVVTIGAALAGSVRSVPHGPSMLAAAWGSVMLSALMGGTSPGL